MTRLLAISDLHVGVPGNARAVADLPAHPGDWLILAGDLGETEAHMAFVFRALAPKFARLLWVPGNHELWTTDEHGLRGQARYEHLVEVARSFGVVTPEDPYPVFTTDDGERVVVAPLFLLYDYTFRPDDVPRERALQWALEHNLVCADEMLLHPDPYPTRDAWCEARCAATEARLAALDPALPTVLVNHFPLRQEHALLPAIPRFSIWCGTRRTEDWHARFRARAVVSGHLHVRSTRFRDGARFEEVSLGYARQWSAERGLASYLREVLPGPR